MVGFFAGVVGELWVNGFLLPDPYLNFKSYSDLSSKIDDLITTSDSSKNLNSEDMRIAQPINKVEPSLVSVYRYKKLDNDSFLTEGDYLGKGVFVTNDGWVMTNFIVAQNENVKYYIVDHDHNIYESESILADEKSNSVFLKISANNFSVAEFALKNDIVEGQNVLLFGRDNEIVVRNIKDFNYSDSAEKGFIHTSEAFYKFLTIENSFGDSFVASPVFNFDGKMVGMLHDSTGVVMPVDYLLPILRNIKKEAFVWPYLGLRYYDLSEVLSTEFDKKKGVLIAKSGILFNSPAKGILKVGDIIVKIENEEINQNKSLPELVNQYQVGDSILMTVIRGEEELVVEVVLD